MRRYISKVFGKRHQDGMNDTTNLNLEKFKEKNAKKTGILIFTVACIFFNLLPLKAKKYII